MVAHLLGAAVVSKRQRPGATPSGGLHVGRPFGRTASREDGEVATASRTGGVRQGERVEMFDARSKVKDTWGINAKDILPTGGWLHGDFHPMGSNPSCRNQLFFLKPPVFDGWMGNG